jgi:hypothetical protein
LRVVSWSISEEKYLQKKKQGRGDGVMDGYEAAGGGTFRKK